MSIRFAEFKVTEQISGVDDLLREHWEELATNKALMVLKPDIARYAAMEQAGLTLAIGAFAGDRMVGYSVSFITQNMHYADLRFAQNDVLFVAKSHRHGRTGYRLISETERKAKERGAQALIWHVKPETPMNKLMPRLGYAVQDILYMREL